MKKNILVAPLNWGLGHATRCIPIINALLQHDYVPIIASDGASLELLKKEYPHLATVELPSYNITYTKHRWLLKFKLILDGPRIIKTIHSERKLIRNLVKDHQLSGIISDNRYGVWHPDVPSIFMTHQLRVFSGSTTWLSTKIQQNLISNFDHCWVPDVSGEPNLSGALGHIRTEKLKTTYIGALSRLEKKVYKIRYRFFVLLSGPEPQRTFLEKILLNAFRDYPDPVLFVKGIVEDEQTIQYVGNLTIYNFMTTKQLEKSLNESRVIIARSGYTTIMDLAKLEKKAFLIPTPGQYEQEYLAQRMGKHNWASFCPQKDFSLEKLKAVETTTGLSLSKNSPDFNQLFQLFQE